MNESEYGMPLSRLSCFAMVEENEKAWFARIQANGLYEWDKKQKRARLLAYFRDFPIDGSCLYIGIEKVGNLLVLAPAAASRIALYDLETYEMVYLELSPVVGERKVKYDVVNCDFIKSYRYGDSVYLFGYGYPAILKVNVKTKQIVYYTDWVEEVEQKITKVHVNMGYVSDYAIAGDSIWALCECANAVIRLDLQTDAVEVIDICSVLDVHIGICFDGNFWVAGYGENDSRLFKYNDSFELVKKIEIASEQKEDDGYSFSLKNIFWVYYPILDLGERLLLFSAYPKHVYEIDKTSGYVRISPVFEELLKIHEGKLHDVGIMTPRKKGNYISFITGNDFLWNEYDYVQDTLARYEVSAESDKEYLRIRSKNIAGKVQIENSAPWGLGYRLTLSRFLEHIACLTKKEDIEMDNYVGVKIYEKIKEEISAV